MTKQTARKQLQADLWHTFYSPHLRSDTWWTGTIVNPLTGEITTPPSLTKQSFKDECDINNIIKAFSVTGQVQHINARASQGTYADLPGEIDFQQSLNTIKEAQNAFASLPSKVRDRFGNDPAQFLAFMSDPANQDEMIKLGLATDSRGAKPPPPPPPAASAADTPPDPKKPA